MQKVLVTGGLGYIGSHLCVSLLLSGFDVVVIDNLSNSVIDMKDKIEEISKKSLIFIEQDIRGLRGVDKVIRYNNITSVIHMAAYKSISESNKDPIEYYDVNVSGSISLIKAMQMNSVKCLVFSSSAAVYGNPKEIPVNENTETKEINPYGRSKVYIEKILKDISESDEEWRIGILRYFNPVGADSSGIIGENLGQGGNNLMQNILRVALGKQIGLRIYGNDYNTLDGTGVRDYLHIEDLVKGHIAALRYIENIKGVSTWNLGTGQGFSVLEMVNAFIQSTGEDIPYTYVSRRHGDVPTCFADTSKAYQELGWRTEKSLDDMCRDSWRWAKNAYTKT